MNNYDFEPLNHMEREFIIYFTKKYQRYYDEKRLLDVSVKLHWIECFLKGISPRIRWK